MPFDSDVAFPSSAAAGEGALEEGLEGEGSAASVSSVGGAQAVTASTAIAGKVFGLYHRLCGIN